MKCQKCHPLLRNRSCKSLGHITKRTYRFWGRKDAFFEVLQRRVAKEKIVLKWALICGDAYANGIGSFLQEMTEKRQGWQTSNILSKNGRVFCADNFFGHWNKNSFRDFATLLLGNLPIMQSKGIVQMHKIIGRGQVGQLIVYALENYLFTNLLSKRGTITPNPWPQILIKAEFSFYSLTNLLVTFNNFSLNSNIDFWKFKGNFENILPILLPLNMDHQSYTQPAERSTIY